MIKMIDGDNVKTVLIENNNSLKLCEEIEYFVRSKQVIDIKYSAIPYGFGALHYALIMYYNES